MPYIKSKSQQLVKPAMNPVSTYSRQVLVQLRVPAGVGNTDYAITPPLGDTTWLLGVDLWLSAIGIGVWIGGMIHIKTGTGREPSAGLIVTRWESIMDTSMLLKGAIVWYGDIGHLHFSMKRLYRESGRRFGIVIENLKANTINALGAFEISEG